MHVPLWLLIPTLGLALVGGLAVGYWVLVLVDWARQGDR